MFKGNGTPLGGLKRIFKKEPERNAAVTTQRASSNAAASPAPAPRSNSSNAAASPTEDELQSLFSEARRLLGELSSVAAAGESSPASQAQAVSELKGSIRRVQAALDRITTADEQFVWQQCVGWLGCALPATESPPAVSAPLTGTWKR